MAQTTDKTTIERELHINAPPETVFAFLVDPEKMVRWWGRSAELDPKPGGPYRVEVNDESIAVGEYVEVEPNRRVVMSFGWEGEESPVPPGSTTIEFDLEPDDQATILRFRHKGLAAPLVDLHVDGWSHYLPRLETVATGSDPGPDPLANAEA